MIGGALICMIRGCCGRDQLHVTHFLVCLHREWQMKAGSNIINSEKLRHRCIFKFGVGEGPGMCVSKGIIQPKVLPK